MAEHLAEKIGPKAFLFFGIFDVLVGGFLVYQSLGSLAGGTMLYAAMVVIAFLGTTFAEYTKMSEWVKVFGTIALFVLGAYALLKLLSTPDIMKFIGLVIFGKGGMTLIHYFGVEHYMGE